MTARPVRLVLGAALAAMALAMVPGAARAQIVWTSAATVTVPQPGVAEYNAGVVQAPNPIRVFVFSFGGARWDLFIRTDDPDMGGGKPITDVEYRVVGSGGWTTLTNGDQPVLQNGGWFGAVDVEFRVRIDWASDPPGNYTTDVVFTATLR